jgi:predicted nucleotidyltransferase
MFLAEVIHSQYDNFLTLCIRHMVKKLYAFGSVITSRFDYIHSDIDLLVEIKEKDPILKGDLLLDFYCE